MSDRRTERFATMLQELEQRRDAAHLLPLFAEDVELQRMPSQRVFRGRTEAREFWREYLETFPEVSTQFHAVSGGDDRAALEWQSSCRLPGGQPIQYTGCTVIEFEGDLVSKLRTYYDSAAVLGRAV
jgi:ketosteroid isomerase-like protein